MEVKGHWSNHMEAIISALPEETDNVKLFGSYLEGTNLISMLLNYILTVHYLNENTCRKSTSLPVMHLHMWFLGLLKNKCRITLLRHAEPNEPAKALEQTADAVLDSARFRSFGSAVDDSDNISFLSN